MKLTFIYSNGKKFTADNVEESSVSIARNNGGDIVLQYSFIKPVTNIVTEMLEREKPPKDSGVTVEHIIDPSMLDIDTACTVNLSKAGAIAVLAENGCYDFDDYPNEATSAGLKTIAVLYSAKQQPNFKSVLIETIINNQAF